MSNIIGGPASSSKGKGKERSGTSRETTARYAGATWNPTGAGSSSGQSTVPISPIPVLAPMGQPAYAPQYLSPSAYVSQAYPGASGSIQPGPFLGPASPPYLQQPPYPAQYGPSMDQYSSSATGSATPTSSFNPPSSASLAVPTSSSNARRRSPRPERLLSNDDWQAFLDTGVMSYDPPESRTRTSRTGRTPEPPSSSGSRGPSAYLPQTQVPSSTMPLSQARTTFSSSPTPYQPAQSSTAFVGQQPLYQTSSYPSAGSSTSYAPAGGSTNYASSRSSTNYAPARRSTSYAPAGGLTSYAPGGGSTSYAPAEGSTSYVSAGSSTSYVSAGGSTSYVSTGGSTNYVPVEASTTYVSAGGSTSYVPGSTSYQALASIPQQGPSNPYPLQPYGLSSAAGPSDPSRGIATAGRGRSTRRANSGGATGNPRGRSGSNPRAEELQQTLANLDKYCRCPSRTSKPHRHWKEVCPGNPNKNPRFYCQRDECIGHPGFPNPDNLRRHMDEVHGLKLRKGKSKEPKQRR